MLSHIISKVINIGLLYEGGTLKSIPSHCYEPVFNKDLKKELEENSLRVNEKYMKKSLDEQ